MNFDLTWVLMPEIYGGVKSGAIMLWYKNPNTK